MEGLTIFFVVSMIVAGTLNTLTTKMQLQTESIDKNGHQVEFSKPWFVTLNMLVGMALVGLVDRCVRSLSPASRMKSDATPSNKDALNLPLVIPKEDSNAAWRRQVLIVSAPAAFDVLATALSSMGLIYIPASIWQMFKGGSVVFCAALSITFLKRKLYGFHWVGLTFVLIGLGIVGASNVLGHADSQDDDNKQSGKHRTVEELIFGMALVMAGQFVQAGQVITEEFLLGDDFNLPGMQIVCWEGIWGTLLMIVVVYPLLWVIPGSDHGHVEDVEDTYAMLKNSVPLCWLVMLYLFSCGSYNASGIAVTGALSGTHRVMMDASRTCVIWAFGLTMHYLDGESKLGEPWTPYSFLQLLGFVILLSGQAIYGSFLRIPKMYYPPPVMNLQNFASPGSLQVSPVYFQEQVSQ